MAKVTGLTASRMYQIEQASIVSGRIENEDELILYTRGGTRIRAGVIKGGTAEWIQEYKPIIDDHTEIMDQTKETIDEVYNKLTEIDPVIKASDEFYTNELPVLREEVSSAVNDSINAIHKANDTIKMVEIEYALGSDLVTAPTSGWTEEYPVRGTNQYIWMRSKITRNDGKPATYSDAVPVTGDQGIPGEKGKDGPPGTDGVAGDPGVSVVRITPLYRRVCNDDPAPVLPESETPEFVGPLHVFVVDGQLEYEK